MVYCLRGLVFGWHGIPYIVCNQFTWTLHAHAPHGCMVTSCMWSHTGAGLITNPTLKPCMQSTQCAVPCIMLGLMCWPHLLHVTAHLHVTVHLHCGRPHAGRHGLPVHAHPHAWPCMGAAGAGWPASMAPCDCHASTLPVMLQRH